MRQEQTLELAFPEVINHDQGQIDDLEWGACRQYEFPDHFGSEEVFAARPVLFEFSTVIRAATHFLE